MDEDCLNLNVFTPAVDGARRPVLVHIFGGGFQSGHANSPLQDGALLAAAADAVVVRVNYRIGALGFLHLGEIFGPPYGANLALLDICAALEWVAENIMFLGGDPDRVTLLGLSSGAFSITALAGVRAARGLFHRAWMASGPASRIIPSDIATEQARGFLAHLGIRPGDCTAIAEVDPPAILQAQTCICATDLGERNAPGGRTLGIVADGVVLAEHPLTAIARGVWKDVPIVLGTTRDEAQLWFASNLMSPTHSFEMVAQEMVRFAGALHARALLNAYRECWPDDSPQRLRQRFLTDAIYRVPALRTAQAQTMAGGSAYVYRFDWCSPAQNGALGAAHGFDEAFIWGAVDRAPYASGDLAAPSLAEAMLRSVIKLAHEGRPDWSPWNASKPETVVFGGDLALTGDDAALLHIWKGIDRP